jgi:hypothetical protein
MICKALGMDDISYNVEIELRGDVIMIALVDLSDDEEVSTRIHIDDWDKIVTIIATERYNNKIKQGG